MRVNIIGPSYTLRSPNIDAQRSVNQYPITDETGEGKNARALVGSPGVHTFCTLPQNECRGAYFSFANNRAFTVYGNKLYEVFADGTYTERGTLLTSTGHVYITGNGIQLCVVDNPNGYIFIYATNGYSQITDLDYPGAGTVCFCDGYFVFTEPNSGRYFISQLYDGTNFDPLEFATAEGNPDNLVAVASLRRNIWEMGQTTVEIAYNSGNPDFPFDRIQGAFIEYGCAGAALVQTLANTIFWVGQDKDGALTIWMAQQYAPQRISTFAIEYLLTKYGARIAEGTAYTYQEEGHFFYCVNVPGMPTTIVYDVTMKEFHERAFIDTNTGLLYRHRAENHMYAFGKHLVGDYLNGKLYWQSLDFYDHDGDVIKRVRACQYVSDDLEYLFHEKLQIDLESGVGLSPETPVEDYNPQMILRWSDDGGHTWSNEHTRAMGKQGQYNKRVIWRALGAARSRIYELSTANRCKYYVIAGHIDMAKGKA